MIMASVVLPENSSCLDLTISVPGFSSSPSPFSSGGKMMKMKKRMMTMRRDLDINKVPSWDDREDQFTDQSMEEIDHLEESPPPPLPSAAAPLPSKKLKLTKDQSHVLEQTFRHDQTLNLKQKEELALQLRLKPRQVEVWFQNRRARSKLKQTEVEYVYLKRWFETLKEQNRKLQKEVEELRSIKVSQATCSVPPSTLTRCPHCESVTINVATSATASSTSDKATSLSFLRPQHSSAAC